MKENENAQVEININENFDEPAIPLDELIPQYAKTGNK